MKTGFMITGFIHLKCEFCFQTFEKKGKRLTVVWIVSKFVTLGDAASSFDKLKMHLSLEARRTACNAYETFHQRNFRSENDTKTKEKELTEKDKKRYLKMF